MKIQKLALLTFLGVVILTVFVVVPLSTPKNSLPETTTSQTPTVSSVIVTDELEDDLSVTTPCVPDYEAEGRFYSDDKTKYAVLDRQCNQRINIYESNGFLLYSADISDEMNEVNNLFPLFVSDDAQFLLAASVGDEGGYFDFWQYQRDAASWTRFEKPLGGFMDGYRYYPAQKKMILIRNWDAYHDYAFDYCNPTQDSSLYFVDIETNTLSLLEHDDEYLSFLDLSPDGTWYTLFSGTFDQSCQGNMTDIEYWLIPFPHDRSDQNAKQLSSAPEAWLDSSTLKLKDGTTVSF